MSVNVTAQSVKLRFPEFEELSDAAVQFAVDEAKLFVDDQWDVSDAAHAVSYLAAHFLSVAESSADVGGREITSESIGQISVSYATARSAGDSSPLKTTTYGTRYLVFLRRNGSMILVV